MNTAMFLSPHLDDVAFSCGGLAASLADRGWRTVLVTAFTRSVHPATGFALACQLDKGLTADIDYMALRRGEDLVAADRLGLDEVLWLDLPEAPQRGYESAPALFAELLPGDGVVPVLADRFRTLKADYQPDLVLAPQGLGGHVDHRQMIAATLAAFTLDHIAFYRDTPYAIRNTDATPHPGVPQQAQIRVPIADTLDRKISAAQAYASQIGFQFQGAQNTARALREFAMVEGNGRPAERLAGRTLPACLAEFITG